MSETSSPPELEAHEKTRPKEVAEPTDDVQTPEEKKTAESLAQAQTELAALNGQLAPLKTERTALVANSALLGRINGHLDNLENSYAAFVEQNEPEFIQAGLTLSDIVTFTINRGPTETALSAARDRLARIAALINGSDQQKGLEAQVEESAKKISRLQNDLGARQREYQTYLADYKRWEARRGEIEGTLDKPDTIQFLKARIKAADETLPLTLRRCHL